MTERRLEPGWKVWRFDQIAVNRVETGGFSWQFICHLLHPCPVTDL